jgi:hypothetical protein
VQIPAMLEKQSRALLILAALTVLAGTTCVRSEDTGPQKPTAESKKIIVPESSQPRPGDKGKKAHTNYLIGNGGKPITPPTPGTTKQPD